MNAFLRHTHKIKRRLRISQKYVIQLLLINNILKIKNIAQDTFKGQVVV